jgi:hypothetical protein
MSSITRSYSVAKTLVFRGEASRDPRRFGGPRAAALEPLEQLP